MQILNNVIYKRAYGIQGHFFYLKLGTETKHFRVFYLVTTYQLFHTVRALIITYSQGFEEKKTDCSNFFLQKKQYYEN